MGLFDLLAAPFTAPTQGAMNIIGGVTGQSAADANAANAASAQQAFERSQGSANQQMAFQERMSNTSYQRAMADMKNAGLNPLLAFSQGGAATPSGASATATAATNQDVGAAAVGNLGKLASAGKDITTLPSTLSQMKAQTESTTAQTAAVRETTPTMVAKQRSEANLNNSTAALQTVQAAEAAARTEGAKATTEKTTKEIQNILKEGKIKDLDYESKHMLLQWAKEHPYHYDAKQILDALNPIKLR